jgi:hypothetical protein
MNIQASARPELAPDYYLSNFQFMLDWVWERYSDLLSEDERFFVSAFNQLERDARCLLVRLSSRKSQLFRRNKLSYTEIICIDSAARQLVDAGLLQADNRLDLQTLAACLTKPELLLLFNEHLPGLKQARKEIIVQQLVDLFPSSRPWQDWTSNQYGAAWYLDNQAIIRTFLLLFFGNAYQDLTEFVLQDLGLYRYEHYLIDHNHRLFQTRAELETYQQMVNLREQLDLVDSIDLLQQLIAQLPAQSANERLERRRAKLCNQIAYELERTGEHLQALQLYEQNNLPPARERRIRLLEKQARFEEAWELLQQLIAAPLNEHELQVGLRMAPRLAKKLDKAFSKKTPTSIIELHRELAQLEDEDGCLLRVEEVVRQQLDSPETPCVYAENALLCGLFGLWLWPEMFRGIEGAFANPFQSAPLDLYQEDFKVRRPGINALIGSLQTGGYQQVIRQTFKEKQGIANHFVNWSFLTEELLELALQNIPALHLQHIFERLLFDIKNNRSGFPDLIVFYPAQKTYRMIEVKGPGDRIQDNQQRWLDYFSLHQLPAEVCYVRWQ